MESVALHTQDIEGNQMNGLFYWLAGSIIIGIPLALIYRKGAMQRIEQNIDKGTHERHAIIKYTMAISIVLWPWAIACMLGGLITAKMESMKRESEI